MYPDAKDEVVQLHLDDIIPNRFQPREIFDERALKELAVSIKQHGVIQPIIVRNVNGKYEIIAGERRYKASALAGLTKIPAIIRDLDDKESSKVALLENLQRKNLNPIEEAKTLQKILELDQLTQEALAKTMGKSQSAIANKLRLLSLPQEVQDALLKEQISERHARTLLNLTDANQQKELLNKIISTKMSVRALENEIKSQQPGNKPQEAIPEVIASTTSFVNNNPLVPTADLPEDKSDYGKVTIAPPEGEDAPMGKFINYGEIGKEETLTTPPGLIPMETTSVNVNEVKSNATDLNTNSTGADLDNLLNLGNPTSSIAASEFITPAEKIVKTDPIEENREFNSDYFKKSDLSAVELPPSVVNPAASNSPIPESSGNYTIDQAEDKIRDLIKDLKEHGIKVTTDEMNFEKSYQIIIKIDKTNE